MTSMKSERKNNSENAHDHNIQYTGTPKLLASLNHNSRAEHIHTKVLKMTVLLRRTKRIFILQIETGSQCFHTGQVIY
jgi:hypothetical protein